VTDVDRTLGTTPVPVSERLPEPVITVANRPYWEAARRGEFRLPRCRSCQAWVYPIAPTCSACGEIGSFDWAEPSGAARLNTWLVYRRPFGPFSADDVPYAVAEVELDEGPRLISSIVGAESLKYRMRLHVAFRRTESDWPLVVFEPATADESA
jgi:uncharacterized protein